MQAMVAAAMAAQFFTSTAISPSLLPATTISSARPFHSSFLLGKPINFNFSSGNLAVAAASKPLTVVAATKKAVAVLKGNSEVEGVVTLLQEDDGPTTVKVRVTGLTPGLHGFHLSIYVYILFCSMSLGILPMAAYLQGHISTRMVWTHGAPEDEVRHAGDLGNIVANSDGVAEATIVDKQIPLSGPNSVVGRAFVVHELEDDLGKGGHELSLSTGNAGGRLACGVRDCTSCEELDAHSSVSGVVGLTPAE